MAKYETHKSTPAGKRATITHKLATRAKYAPPMPLAQLARELNVKVVAK